MYFLLLLIPTSNDRGRSRDWRRGHTKRVGVGVGCVAHSCLCVYSPQYCRGGEEFRPYESASEAIRNRHNHATLWQLECNSAESSFLRPPFLWNHQHCHKNYLLGAADLSTINECTKTAILTFWEIVLEILDTVGKLFMFCWISNFTELKALRLFILFVELETSDIPLR